MPRYAQFLVMLLCLVTAIAIPSLARGTSITDVTQNSPAVTLSENGETQLQYCSPLGNTAIPDNNGTGITSVINVPDAAQISDLNVFISVTHNYVGDLYISLTNNGTTRDILDRPRGGNCRGDNINNYSDDEAGPSFEADCSNGSSAYIPGQSYYSGTEGADPLSAFDNRTTAGDWILNIQDRAWFSTGALRQWCVQFTVPDAPPTATPSPTTIAPSVTPTPSATPPQLPTGTATTTPTVTPEVSPTHTPTVTPSSTPLPGTQYLYASLVVRNYAPLNCQTVENETQYPNDSVDAALLNPPLCPFSTLSGRHDTPGEQNAREDIYRLEVETLGTIAISLDVPDINLNLELYDSNVVLVERSANPDTADESIREELQPGTYFVRIYRSDTNSSAQPYYLTTLRQ